MKMSRDDKVILDWNVWEGAEAAGHSPTTTHQPV